MRNTANNPAATAAEAEYLSGFVVPERLERMLDVLSRRTRYMTVCAENTFHPQNASALVRTCEAFGVQDIHTVENLCRFDPSLRIVRGTDKWITFRRHPSSAEALSFLKAAGYRIAAATPHAGGTPPEEFDVEAGPFAVVFGTELDGISDAVGTAADSFMEIPMCGFVESLNVSASAAIIVHALASRLRRSGAPWSLSPEERTALLHEWLRGAVKDSARILERFRTSRPQLYRQL